MKLNPPIRCRGGFHPRRGFHRRRRFHPPVRVDLVENDRFLSESVVFCLWATKKIFLPFLRMNSNSCKNEILAGARMKSANADEIFGFASDEIKSTHPPSRRISSNEVGFHRRIRFHPPARVDLVEKPTCRNKSVFLAGAQRLELWTCSFGDCRSTN